ncbi:MAG: hypothetical protein JOZ49_17125, partial [Mycolicibacterium sp.]|nr:hypothetical protein [Mycolicibacterium sp.]
MAEATSVGDARRAAPAVDDATGKDTWLRRLGRAIVNRLPLMTVAIGAGLLLCVSFPP